MKQLIVSKIEEVLKSLQAEGILPDFATPEVHVERPKDEQFGEYTSNIALMISKEAGKNPREIAMLLQEKLADDFARVEVAGPGYINFYLGSGYFQRVVESAGQESLSNSQAETVMIEYSQPNTHKEFHIGHLRNVFIGSTLVNILRRTGKKVIAANYIGDTGTHIAKCLWGIQTFYKEVDLDSLENKAEFLGQVYADATQKIGENPEYEEQFKALQNRFEAGDQELVALWEKTKEWSMDEFRAIYKELGVVFDEYFYESIEEEAGKKLLPELLEKGILKESEGAVIADLEQYNLGVLVLVRKDGSALYGLKDIPLAKKKFEEFKIDKSIYVVDIRQEFYFKQLFKILELYGFHKNMIHYGYEFVALKGGETMSSRKGNIIAARTLMDDMESKVKEQFPGSPNTNAIAIGAIRFAMLKHSNGSKIEFDVEESVRLDGATGPYVQYAHARINSILTKAIEEGFSLNEDFRFSEEMHSKEKELIRELSKFSENLVEIAETGEVHKLSHYSLKVAEKFHSFYSQCKVVDKDNVTLSQQRLKIIRATQKVLAECLGLMGISAPEKM